MEYPASKKFPYRKKFLDNTTGVTIILFDTMKESRVGFVQLNFHLKQQPFLIIYNIIRNVKGKTENPQKKIV